MRGEGDVVALIGIILGFLQVAAVLAVGVCGVEEAASGLVSCGLYCRKRVVRTLVDPTVIAGAGLARLEGQKVVSR